MSWLHSALGPRPRAPKPELEPDLDSPVTTELDIRMCFRLLLGRAPNPEEWEGHSAHAGQDLARVVAGYLGSLEFARRGLTNPPEATEPHLATHPGFQIYADPADLQIGQHVLAGAYEPEVTAIFHHLLRPGMTVIDIGANIGFFALLAAAAVGPDGAVLAIEPNPANARLLEASRRHNGFAHITVAQVAASDTLGLLALNTTHSNGTTAEPGGLDQLLQSRTVPALPVDTLAQTALPNRRVDLIKVDVEGAEYRALRGALALITRDHPTIITEFSPNLMPGISGVDGPTYLAWLHALGYQIAVIHPETAPEAMGQDADAVMQAYANRGSDHIDLLATLAT